TARRAAASITDAGDDCIPIRYFRYNVGVCGRAVIRFCTVDNISGTELRAQHAVKVGEIALGSLFAIRDKTDGFALEGRWPRGWPDVLRSHLVCGIEDAKYQLRFSRFSRGRLPNFSVAGSLAARNRHRRRWLLSPPWFCCPSRVE